MFQSRDWGVGMKLFIIFSLQLDWRQQRSHSTAAKPGLLGWLLSSKVCVM